MNDIIFSYRLYRIFAGLERKTARSVVFATEVPWSSKSYRSQACHRQIISKRSRTCGTFCVAAFARLLNIRSQGLRPNWGPWPYIWSTETVCPQPIFSVSVPKADAMRFRCWGLVVYLLWTIASTILFSSPDRSASSGKLMLRACIHSRTDRAWVTSLS